MKMLVVRTWQVPLVPVPGGPLERSSRGSHPRRFAATAAPQPTPRNSPKGHGIEVENERRPNIRSNRVHMHPPSIHIRAHTGESKLEPFLLLPCIRRAGKQTNLRLPPNFQRPTPLQVPTGAELDSAEMWRIQHAAILSNTELSSM